MATSFRPASSEERTTRERHHQRPIGKGTRGVSVTIMSREELAALPAVIDIPTASRVLGVGRSAAYELVRTGKWPTPVLRLGRLIKVPSAPLLELIGFVAATQHS